MIAGYYQFNPVFGNKEENLERVRRVLLGHDFELMVLPEFFATGYQFVSGDEVRALSEPVPGGPTTEMLAEVAGKKSAYIVGGLPEVDDGRYYNSAVIVGPEGFVGSYRKSHLFFEEKLYFSPGNTGFRVFDTDLGRIGIMICFDWFFPESVRTLALKGAEVIAHPANLVLPYCPQGMPIRCLENRVFAITANRTGSEERKEGKRLTYIGLSQIVSPGGDVVLRASPDEEEIGTRDIEPSAARNKDINGYNNLFSDRRPDLYEL